MKRILIIRFAALGDVAMTIPVVLSFMKQYPDYHVTYLSKNMTAPLFSDFPKNFTFKGVDMKDFQGLKGTYNLYKQLCKTGEKFDFVIDLNAILASILLDVCFYLNGVKVSVISKGKKEQKKLTCKTGKKMKPLLSMFERYRMCFTKIDFPFEWNYQSPYKGSAEDLNKIEILCGDKKDKKWIGIAPFAAHRGKIYPIELQEQVVASFGHRPEVKVFIFGGGQKEKEVAEAWAKKYPSVCSVVGLLKSMYLELLLLEKLDVLVSMDSANMHLASLVGTPVVSVWGATHVNSGFLGWNQDLDNVVDLSLDCRPCSSHGTKPCYKGTWECMQCIQPQKIIEKIENNLS